MTEKVIVDLNEARAHFSRLLERVANGEEIIITRAGKPVATLSPFTEPKEPRKPGGWEGKIWTAEDWDSDDVNREIEELFYGSEIEPPD